jgi:hypothetical protein
MEVWRIGEIGGFMNRWIGELKTGAQSAARTTHQLTNSPIHQFTKIADSFPP